MLSLKVNTPLACNIIVWNKEVDKEVLFLLINCMEAMHDVLDTSATMFIKQRPACAQIWH